MFIWYTVRSFDLWDSSGVDLEMFGCVSFACTFAEKRANRGERTGKRTPVKWASLETILRCVVDELLMRSCS